MKIQTLAKLKDVLDELEAEWQPYKEKFLSKDAPPVYSLPKEAIEARDNVGVASDLYLRFLKQFTKNSFEHLMSIGYVKKPETFLAQKVGREDGA